MKIKVTKLHFESKLPTYATDGSAGLDLYAVGEDAVVLIPHRRVFVKTGIAIEIPPGFEGQVRSRSGLALKHGVVVLNAPGTIDSDYRGEIGAVLINHGQDTFTVLPGDRIAQLVIAPVVRAELELVEELGATKRGAGGFGSSGR